MQMHPLLGLRFSLFDLCKVLKSANVILDFAKYFKSANVKLSCASHKDPVKECWSGITFVVNELT